MWRLNRSRGLFLTTHDFPQNRTVWAVALDEMERQNVSQESLRQITALRKSPEFLDLHDFEARRSNCPVVDQLAEDLIRLAPVEWKALLSNVFFGISLEGEPGAFSVNKRDAGIVSLSIQYVWMIEAYVLAFDAFLEMLRGNLTNWAEVEAGAHGVEATPYLRDAWNRLEENIVPWRDPNVVYAGSAAVYDSVPGRRVDGINVVTSAAQLFAMTHEVAHHILGHTVENPGRRSIDAHKLLDESLPEASKRFINSSPGRQRDELLCDALAVLLLSGKLSPLKADTSEEFNDAYRAIAGACFALLPLTHSNEHWVFGVEADEHPPLRDRWQSLILLAECLWSNAPRAENQGHPVDFLNQLRVFMDAAYTHCFASSNFGFARPEPSVDDAALLMHYLTAWEERISDRYPAHTGDS